MTFLCFNCDFFYFIVISISPSSLHFEDVLYGCDTTVSIIIFTLFIASQLYDLQLQDCAPTNDWVKTNLASSMNLQFNFFNKFVIIWFFLVMSRRWLQRNEHFVFILLNWFKRKVIYSMQFPFFSLEKAGQIEENRHLWDNFRSCSSTYYYLR